MPNHIKDIYIKSFKGIKDLKLEDMKSVNILVGDNNSKKTTVLEAVELFERPYDFISHIKRISRKYNLKTVKYNKIKEMFYNCDLDNEININLYVKDKLHRLFINGKEEQLICIDDNGQSNELKDIDRTILRYEFNNEPKEFIMNDNEKSFVRPKKQLKLLNIGYMMPIDTYIESRSIEAIDRVIQKGEKQRLIDMLKIFDDNIVDINFTSDREIYITTNDKLSMSMGSFGDGFKKAIILTSKVIDAENGILLVDEIETGIHKDIIGKILKEIIKNSKLYNTQIIATTHSLEAIGVLLEKFDESLNEVAIYRLEEFKDQIYSRRFSGDKAYEIVVQEGGDLR
ncbi:AAA family ATPase [Clostridium sp. CCUG 7971]|uniref:AAA family ATPase n=1 Tax=Clostridium sp. CCUG 7971 TaxID=2811414 RepID=UPI001ABB7F2B|nr:AAA family ATPase [Clostridium sp. CCUG 7971]MBO3442959.1 AAA family ATPase [Clostridium sp. CCUG 7971]